MLRELYTWLAAYCDAHTLRELGWFHFFRGGAPQTDDARVLGAAAVFHLLVDEAGKQIHHDDSVVYAVLAFVEAKRGGRPPTRVSQGLAQILSTPPVTRQAVEDWFRSTYP